MRPAVWPRDDVLEERLLLIDPAAGAFGDARIRDFPSLLRPGDLLIVNDAATVPASIAAEARGRESEPVEIRLLALGEGESFSALVFGAGDWRSRTEDRPPPPALAAGDWLWVGGDLSAEVLKISPISPRIIELRFNKTGADLWWALYRQGKPVQYSYLRAPLELWHTQTRYAARPWCVEAPSAGRPLTWSLLLEMGRRGVSLASLTHAAGLSSTGDPALDALLPLPERFEIPAATVEAIRRTRAASGRVVAVGTTVVRALEGCAAQNGGDLVAGAGIVDFIVRRGYSPRVVDGLFTGMHEPHASHFELLAAFADPSLIEAAYDRAERAGYLGHEYGDSNLILSRASEAAIAA
ncbi:MAG TPA: S-adenosylmethionine:tRNA ribosyltransferase-isomerase [Polyangiaceae bacterium]|nr:S-adenosylmethionine:tRNA ribosyltransferase-isomerase [Polyangiaceae bacterium]